MKHSGDLTRKSLQRSAVDISVLDTTKPVATEAETSNMDNSQGSSSGKSSSEPVDSPDNAKNEEQNIPVSFLTKLVYCSTDVALKSVARESAHSPDRPEPVTPPATVRNPNLGLLVVDQC